ncbi:hypothetical protein ACIBF7_23550 [Nonomuraea sp. NPDC050478]|uniref:hypothetical protein n=1 Tax=Nonomuraea sp. NPDC050478 TaxID=3364365 RepID=UPI0037924242
MVDDRDPTGRPLSALPVPPHEEPPPPPPWKPAEEQVVEAFSEVRRHPRAVLWRAAVVAVPALLAQSLLARVIERPAIWHEYTFLWTRFADALSAIAILAVNSAAIVVLSGLLAPTVIGANSPPGTWRGLARLCGLTFLLTSLGLAMYALFPVAAERDIPVSGFPGAGPLFFLAALFVVAAVEIRFAFAAPGVTVKGLGGRQAVKLSRRLTRGQFFKILSARCVLRALLEGFGGILGAAVLLRATGDDPAGGLGPAGWTVLVAVKWAMLTCVLATASMLAVVQFADQDKRLSREDATGEPS